MWPVDSARVAEIASSLDSAGLSDICQRCRLRLAGVKDSREHKRVDTESREKSGPSSPKKKRPSPCRACLGVLQEEFMEDASRKVVNYVMESGFDSDHFTIAVSLPVSLALRSHSLEVFLRQKLDVFDEDEIIPIKQVWKWIFPHRIEKAVGKKYVTGDACQFYVELEIQHQSDKEELMKLLSMCEKEYKMRQKKHRKYHMGLVTRQGADNSLSGVPDTTFSQHYPVPPEEVPEQFRSEVTVYHNSIYIAGRYNKYSRELPQTPWLVDGEKRMPTSVEEIISDQLKTFFTFDSAKFSSSGREDVDVRMLGRGRPFLFEVTNPRKTKFTAQDMDALSTLINETTKDLQVRDLQIVSKSEIKYLKEGEDTKTKTYTALCVMPEEYDLSSLKSKLECLSNMELDQWTPIRVLHRRPNNLRKRTVYSMLVSPVSEVLFKLRLSTQAGTYVKEFVHGDFNRTNPNLRVILGCDVDIVALDVEDIDLDWPPTKESKSMSSGRSTPVLS